VPHQPFEAEGVVEELALAVGAAVAHLAELRLELERLGERVVLPLHRRRVELRHLVGLAVGELEDAPDVLDGGFPLEVPNVMMPATRSSPYFSRT
jgi:hypothetical protein